VPLREVKGKNYATFSDDVVLPKDAPVIPGPKPKYSFIKSVELSYIEGLVKSQTAMNAQPNNALRRSAQPESWARVLRAWNIVARRRAATAIVAVAERER
jgi:hypothetical protein